MYDKIVDYYDMVHESLTADIGFITRLAAQHSGRLLELGCGTGRLLLPLARLGHEIVGIDSSEAMLERARLKLNMQSEAVQKRVSVHYADMVDFDLGGQFSLIIYPHNTLMHLDREQLRSSLSSVMGHCLPGGQVLIDVDNPIRMADPYDNDLVILEKSHLDQNRMIFVQQFSASNVDSDEQMRHVTWMFDEFPVSGGNIKRTLVRSTLYYYYPHELIEVLHEFGFTVAAQLGDYNGDDYGEESERLLILANRFV